MAGERKRKLSWLEWLGIVSALFTIAGIPGFLRWLDFPSGSHSAVTSASAPPASTHPTEGKWERSLRWMSTKHVLLPDPREGVPERTASGLVWEAQLDDIKFSLDGCSRHGTRLTCVASVKNEGAKQESLELSCPDDDPDRQVKLVDSAGLVHLAIVCSIGGSNGLSLDPNVVYRMSAEFRDVSPPPLQLQHVRFGFGWRRYVSFHDVPVTGIE